jgi:hypothetical protein
MLNQEDFEVFGVHENCVRSEGLEILAGAPARTPEMNASRNKPRIWFRFQISLHVNTAGPSRRLQKLTNTCAMLARKMKDGIAPTGGKI